MSVTLVVILSLAGAMWTFGVVRYLRHHGPHPDLGEALYQVDLVHAETPGVARGPGSTHTTAAWATHTRVSFPEYSLLAASGIPPRQAASFRSRLLVSTRDGARDAMLARPVPARFVNAPFFPLFRIPIGHGRAFDSAEEMGRAPVVVLGERLARTLFATATATGNSGTDPSALAVGKRLLVEGRPFRVVGVVRGDQPFRPTWDISMMDADQDALYLPFGWFRPLRARPEAMVQSAPIGPGFEDLLRSEAVFVSFWLELPTPETQVAYLRYLDERFARRGVSYVLRSYPEWADTFGPPLTRVAFLSFLTGLLLLAAGFSATRLLLTRSLGRNLELGVRRALGASRRSIFAGQMLEAGVLSLLSAGLGTLLAVPYLALFNTVVADADIPARLSSRATLLGAGGVCLVGLLSALYPAWRLSASPTTVHSSLGATRGA